MQDDKDALRPPPIPLIPSELVDAVSALAHAAFIFRGIFVQITEGKSVDEIFAERGPYLVMAERVIDTWCEHLGIDPEQDATTN
jgi:hypothetical protein